MGVCKQTYISTLQVDFVGELLANLVEGTIAPISKPVQHTSKINNLMT